MINAQILQCIDGDTWPPDQLNCFAPLVLLHHQHQRTQQQVSEMAKLVQTGDIESVVEGQHTYKTHMLSTSTVTKEIAEILTPLEKSISKKLILIEGAPGIGKSVLLKHIAFKWAHKLILERFKIVLLICLRDPSVHKIMSVSNLIQLFLKGDAKAKEISTACSDYLFSNGGKDVAFLLDGYDEFPDELQTDSLIADILNCKVLPLCSLIVSSRPHASVSLRIRAALQVDILGFTELERVQFIKQALKDQPHKIEELTWYLKHHVMISTLCSIPFNMVIMVFLMKNEFPLPKSSTELYSYFVCFTVCRSLYKIGYPLRNDIKDLSTLPEPCNKIIKQLGKLSIEALNNNELVFTFDKIKLTCPDIISTPGAINGYGLLQVVEHFGLFGKTMTFNFLHFTIQEYLAAHYIITYLPAHRELQLLQENFWSDLYANMFAIYVTMTKGQQPAFKQFLCGGDNTIAIAKEFLCDQLKCIHLYYCFYDGEDKRMYKSIEEAAVFDKMEINLNAIKLSPCDLEYLSLFLATTSHKHWVKLDLGNCYIRDCGLFIIHKVLRTAGVTIKTLNLDYNGLTQSSASFITDIVLSCKVEVLLIKGNHTIGESEELYTMLSHSSTVLNNLSIEDTLLSSSAATKLFSTMINANRLQFLNVSFNKITDDVADTIASLLNRCTSLDSLDMFGNPISGEAIQRILQSLQTNDTLTWLSVPSCSRAIEKNIVTIQEQVNKMRKKQGIKQELLIDSS
ncbi:protein NLRC5-like [Dysidea avara]|uniref:protein NLRC5-like n=1 Tax=Dysidea avara TaxID=196820 RepID=UPI00332F74C9